MKEHAPSTERNREAILEALKQVLPPSGLVLEIASGTGQHAVHFAPAFPELTWQPTDKDPKALASIRAWTAEASVPNILEPLPLDVMAEDWPIAEARAMVNINMLHISPWEACEGLLRGASRVLHPGSPLFYYGAFIRADRETAPSNLEFDRSLKQRNPQWGIRKLEDVIAVAERAGLVFEQATDMPNNNFTVVFRAR